MKVQAVCEQLEQLLSDLSFSGLVNMQPALLVQIKELRGWMSELGMQQGEELLGELERVLVAFQREECPAFEAVDMLCALEFYHKNMLREEPAQSEEEDEG